MLAIAVGLAKFLISLKKQPEKQEVKKIAPSVKVMTVEPVSKAMTIDAFGTVKPRKLVRIAAEVPGRIDYINPAFIEGGEIEKEELLVRIDQRSYKLDRQTGLARIRQAKTDIESLKQDIENLKNDIKLSRANVALAKKELNRIEALSKNKFASKNSLDKSEQQYLQARIQLQNIKSRLALTDTLMEQKNTALAMARVDFQKADLALEKTRIKADFNGLVLEKFAEKGEYVNPGQILGSIYQKNHLDVDVRIPLEKMRWIEVFFKNGQTPDAEVMVADSEDIKPFAWDAKVARVKAEIDEKTRTLPMTLEIASSDVKRKHIFDLKPGTFVKCSIAGEKFDNIFIVPRYLLKRGNILFTVNDNHLKMKKVNVLRKIEEKVYIQGGLAAGDKIISSPLPGALDGMELTIKTNGK